MSDKFKFDEKFTCDVKASATQAWREREAFGRKVGSALIPLVGAVEVQKIRKIGSTISAALEHKSLSERVGYLDYTIELMGQYHEDGDHCTEAGMVEFDNRVDKMNELSLELHELESDCFSVYVDMLDRAKEDLPALISAITELDKLKLNVENALLELNHVVGVVNKRSSK